jgi:hypothetical protein
MAKIAAFSVAVLAYVYLVFAAGLRGLVIMAVGLAANVRASVRRDSRWSVGEIEFGVDRALVEGLHTDRGARPQTQRPPGGPQISKEQPWNERTSSGTTES